VAVAALEPVGCAMSGGPLEAGTLAAGTGAVGADLRGRLVPWWLATADVVVFRVPPRTDACSRSRRITARCASNRMTARSRSSPTTARSRCRWCRAAGRMLRWRRPARHRTGRAVVGAPGRPTGVAAINAAKTVCCRGHRLDDAYVWRDRAGYVHRQCRRCTLAAQHARRRRSMHKP
jgi:hypothetical protein